MISLLTTLFLALFAVTSLASPWTIRPRNDSNPLRVRKDEFQLSTRRDTSSINFSLPLQRRNDSSPLRVRNNGSPLSPRELSYLFSRNDTNHLKGRNEINRVHPRDAFALRPRIRPRKDGKAALQTRNDSFPLRPNYDAPPNLPLAARQDDNTSDPAITNSSTTDSPLTIPTHPGFNATILAPNGTDITPAFKIMLYHAPAIVATTDLNGKSKRQVGLARPINHCQSPTAVFINSHCTQRAGVSGTMQSYIVFCRERSRSKQTSYYVRAHPEPGACNDDEICFDGKDDRPPYAKMARCVPRRGFQPIVDLPSTNDLEGLTRAASGDVASASMDNLPGMTQGSSSQDLAGLRAAVVLSEVDEDTPMEAQEMELDAGIAASVAQDGTVNSDGTASRQSSCDQCLQVSTAALPERTNWARARAASTLAGMIGGVMWVALFN